MKIRSSLALALVALTLFACSSSGDGDVVGSDEGALNSPSGSSGSSGSSGTSGSGDSTSAAPINTASPARGTKCTSGASACLNKQAGDSCGGSKTCKNAPICTCA